MAKAKQMRVSGVSLDNVTPLLLPWLPDAWGMLRPPVSVDAMRMSAQLAADTYAMNVEPWLQAGWRDVTIQLDGELTGGVEQEVTGTTAVDKLFSALKLRLVQSRLKQRNAIGQVTGALRQIDGSDTGKALVMIHPAPDGRYVVAVSFMGTGEQLYDWFSNFRMSSEEGIHRGFLQLTRQFEDNEQSVVFPETAQELGLETLTLRHILEEMRHPNSRFVLWLSGHSQGGALMQVYCRRKIEEDGVLPQHIVGYGFASPTVATGTAVNAPGNYPLYHVINADDLVPRMGAAVHLGVLLQYRPDDAMRRACYTWAMDETSLHDRGLVKPIVDWMTSTPRCIETGVAYINALAGQNSADVAESLGAVGLPPALMKVADIAELGVDRLLRYAGRRLAAAYQSISGEEISRARIADMEAMITSVMDEIGVKRFALTLADFLTDPHTINSTRTTSPAYLYIVQYAMDALEPMQWLRGAPPMMLRAGRAQPERTGLNNRRRLPALRQIRRGRSITALRGRTDTRHHAAAPVQGSLRVGETMILHK
ncbi:MAG: hypothetical protein IKK21_05755 [Clostridia bacterium]|nr:hypothetical protein [Clostridia bacterium]